MNTSIFLVNKQYDIKKYFRLTVLRFRKAVSKHKHSLKSKTLAKALKQKEKPKRVWEICV